MQYRKTIALGYIGVHQIFQLALAAHEAGLLERLYCSLFDAPGKWGRWLARWSNASSLRPLGSDGLPAEKVTELPLPILSRRLHRLLRPDASPDYGPSNRSFDRSVAQRLAMSEASLFVGTETCALESFRAARRLGLRRLLDCPGIPHAFLGEELRMAADNLEFKELPPSGGEQGAHIDDEIEAADMVVLCSAVQRDYYGRRGVAHEKMRINPLWVDPAFANSPSKSPERRSGPLRALFVGAATLGKGAPYALQAVNLVKGCVNLTFCGGMDPAVRRWAGPLADHHEFLEWRPRAELAKVYRDHDVLIFPTLGDSFGFVALEAMACGLPVITTMNAGVPVPDPSWRVPARDSTALAKRLECYALDRDLLAADSKRAQDFAAVFTPENYRHRAIGLFEELMSN